MDVDVDAESSAVLVAEHGQFKLTTTGVVATGEPTFAEWEAAVEWVKRVEKASPFWLGDLLAYGERKYGEMYAQALDATDSSYGTLANAAWVAGHVESSRRREHLSFAHHQEVAPLAPAEQVAWLDKCEAEGLSHKQLRVQIKVAKAEASGQLVDLWVMVKCSSLDDQAQLADRLKLEGRVVKMTAVTP